MDIITIFTNNSIVVEVLEQYNFPIEIKWVSAPAMEVITTAKNAVSNGALVLSNPMSGVRTQSQFNPFQKQQASSKGEGDPDKKIISINPYLSILTSSHRKTVDLTSIMRLNDAYNVYKKNARLRFVGHSDDTIKTFQSMDLEVTLANLAKLSHRES